MDPDALAAVKDLDGRRGEPNVELLVKLDQDVRDGVVVLVDLDVVVDVDADLSSTRRRRSARWAAGGAPGRSRRSKSWRRDWPP